MVTRSLAGTQLLVLERQLAKLPGLDREMCAQVSEDVRVTGRLATFGCGAPFWRGSCAQHGQAAASLEGYHAAFIRDPAEAKSLFVGVCPGPGLDGEDRFDGTVRWVPLKDAVPYMDAVLGRARFSGISRSFVYRGVALFTGDRMRALVPVTAVGSPHYVGPSLVAA